MKLTGKIYSGKYFESTDGSPTFLSIGGKYPDAPLTVVIWGDVRSKFKVAPEREYIGRQMFIVGNLPLYKGKPQITITDPQQLSEVVSAPIEKAR